MGKLIGEQRFRDTVSLSEAVRFSGSTAFSLMIKPVGSACNLGCSYCYYLGKGTSPCTGGVAVMSEGLLDTCLRNFLESCDLPEPTIEWHGGEPLLAGMDFFRKAVSLERRYASGRIVRNTIQTNGVLLSSGWASFFADNGFLVGISIDGPEHIHDRYRKDRGGHPTFGAVMRGIEILSGGNVEFNTMTAVSKAGEENGAEVYLFLKSIGSRYMQFMPVYEHIMPGNTVRPQIVCPGESGSAPAPWSVEPEAFGRYLCDIFDIWIKRDVGEYFVPMFDAALACMCGISPGICVFCESCGGNLVVERNGDIYPCDHFVYDGYRLGNVAEISLRRVATSAEMGRFGIGKRSTLPAKCISCRYRYACNGGCPKHRFMSDGSSSLCDGYRLFYSHIEDDIAALRRRLYGTG